MTLAMLVMIVVTALLTGLCHWLMVARIAWSAIR